MPARRSPYFWTARQDDKFRRLWPDYDALARAFPNRTKRALYIRATVLKLVTPKHRWTRKQTLLLKAMCAGRCTKRQLLAAFTGFTWEQIKRRAQGLDYDRDFVTYKNRAKPRRRSHFNRPRSRGVEPGKSDIL